MAKARVTQVEKITYEDGVTLELTLAEARALYALTNRVGGDARYTPRGLTDKIGAVLKEACKPQGDTYRYDDDPKAWAQPEYNLFSGYIKTEEYPEHQGKSGTP